MVVLTKSPRRETASQNQAVMGYYQRYTGMVNSNVLDTYLQRALAVKNGDVESAIDYASLLVKRIEGVRSPCSPRGLEDSPCARTSPYLQRQPDSILAAVSEFLEPEDFCALRASSSTICDALKHPATGKVTAYHITDAAAEAKDHLDENCVRSIRFRHTVDPMSNDEKCMDATDAFPNCRTVVWRPDTASAPRQGDYVESIFFNLQGMENLYMRLYPHGKERSKPGYCSVYVGSCGTDKDVMLKVRIGRHSHIIAQKLSGDYVDGFVNFCPALGTDSFEVSLEVLHGPHDDDLECMDLHIPVHGNIAQWSIPRMSRKTIDSFSMGDRITSDNFTLPGMGDESCFVIYPKGDTVDAISSVGNFVNVGLFGSSDQDVTFRLSAGSVSKVLTACCDRYKTKDIGKTKSCGEFFDACFATIDQLVDFRKAKLDMKLEVLDTVSRHRMTLNDGQTTWQVTGIDQMLPLLAPGEQMFSRYIHLPNVPGVFMNYAISYDRSLREIVFEIFCINGARDSVSMNIDFNFQFGCDLNAIGYDVGKTQSHQENREIMFRGLRDSVKFTFKQDQHIPIRMFFAKVKTSNVQCASLHKKVHSQMSMHTAMSEEFEV